MNMKTERKLRKLAIDLYWVWLDYIDSLPEKGNEMGKKEAYLDIAIFRDAISIDSTHDKDELKPRHQINWFEHPVRKEVKDGKTRKEEYNESLYGLRTYINGDIAIKPYYYFRNGLLHVRYTVDRCIELSPDEISRLKTDLTCNPSRKQEVADMMVLRALSTVYGQNVGMTVDYPTPRSIEYLEDGRVKILFHNVWSNLQSISARNIIGFELAGEDRVFQLAEAEVEKRLKRNKTNGYKN